jgi:acetoin utilization deacetylase AcuC-like enzyme
MSHTCYAYHPIEQKHKMPGHVENPRRTAKAMALLRERGAQDQMMSVPVSPITSETLHQIHDPAYVARIKQIDEMGGGMWDFETYVVRGSDEAARMSAGAAIAVTRAVVSGQARNGISIMRPPGHHALPDKAMGFCLFANMALAARAAQAEMGLERVLIIDWDVHHGNGTEAIFYDDPGVAFISLHQHPLWPGTGMVADVGAGAGAGYTMNIPMPPHTGDSGYLQAFDELIVPFACRFQPQLILISSGYDAHWRDPLSQMNVTSTGYVQLTRRARMLAEELCDGRLVVLLEGGYDLGAVSYGIWGTALALMGRDADAEDPFGPAPSPETDVSNLVNSLKRIHQIK